MSHTFSVAVNDALWQRLEDEVKDSGQKRNRIVREALESRLGVVGGGSSGPTGEPSGGPSDKTEKRSTGTAGSARRGRQAKPAPVETEAVAVPTSHSADPVLKDPMYSCPAHGCKFTSPSPAAKCGVHGRTVK